MKLFLYILLLSGLSIAQITIDECNEKAKENYPLIKQYNLIDQLKGYNLSNANTGYLPQISISGKATYQSEVTEFPLSIPNMKVNSLSKDQYQAAAEINQVVWDGGAISAQKDITSSSSELEKQKLNVDLFAIEERVNQIFFGILLLDEQLKLNKILQAELQLNFDKVSALIKNGVANQADLDVVKVEQLNAKKREIELKYNNSAYREMLSSFTGLKIDENSTLVKPNIDNADIESSTNNRPELNMFNAQKSLFENQRNSINASNLPKISLFLQGGYGRPGLNMLKDEFSAFYIGGIRFSWNLSSFYSRSNNLDIIELNRKSVDLQSETFLFNTNMKLTQQKSEINKYKNILAQDSEIIALRNNVKKSAEAKYENGTYSINDLIREINLENISKLDKSLHEIQLTQAVYNLLNTTNN